MPVIFTVSRPFVRVVGAELIEVTFVVGTNLTYTVVVFVNVCNLVFYAVSAHYSAPVIFAILAPIVREYVSMVVIPCTSFADSVVVFVNVSCLIAYNAMSACCFVPVIIVIVRPISRVCVLVIVVPSASVADTVVVFVSMKCLVSNLYCVSTSNCMPVIISIVRPIFSIFMLVIVVPSATFADTVVVFIGVSCLVSTLNVVSAGYSVPVIVVVVSPILSIGVSTELIFAYLTEAVVVFIGVSCLVSALNVMSAGNSVPVLGCIVRPFGSIGVSVIVVPATSITYTVVVFVKVW